MERKDRFLLELKAALSSFGIEPLTRDQLDRLAEHYRLLKRWNRRLNLTRITEPGQAARLHYAESLLGARFIGSASSLLDIGSGAGFPSIPMAVLRPDVKVTAVEANWKKAVFLKEVKEALVLSNFDVVRARFEEIDRSGYELITARALERAEEAYLQIIESLIAGQRFLLYCSPELLSKIKQQQLRATPMMTEAIEVTLHEVPQTRARLVAIFEKR
jgi:16S rRNA (guanine527-N7)-methyltransferase